MTAAASRLAGRRARLALIHVAKKQTGLSDDTYRALLEGAAGVHSAAEIETDGQFEAVMQGFAKFGFKRGRSGSARQVNADSWGCSARQRAYIEALWKRYSREKTPQALHAFIRRTCGIDHPRFLTPRRASEVIVGIQKLGGEQGA